MLLRIAAVAGLLALAASPADSQTTDSTPAPRARIVPRYHYRIPEVRIRIPRTTRIDVQDIRRRALEQTQQARRKLHDRGLELRLRAEVRSNMLDDRMTLRQPLLRRRHFRDI